MQKLALETKVAKKKSQRRQAAIEQELKEYRASVRSASEMQTMASEKIAMLRAELCQAKSASEHEQAIAKALKMSVMNT